MNIPFQQIPGASRLIIDYFENFSKVADFFNGDYRAPQTFAETAKSVAKHQLPLTELAPILREQNQFFDCGAQTLEKIDLLANNQACAVVTGQQTGLFGGPLFTIYKTLTALKLAASLNRNHGASFVPVFWLASDDHDFAEVAHVAINDKANQPYKISYESPIIENKLPVSKIILTEAIEKALSALSENTHPSDFKDDVLAALTTAYQPGTSFSHAFGKWMMTLFKSFGLIIIDASEPRIKALATDIFLQEISGSSSSSHAAAQTSQILQDRGYHTQVSVKENFSNLFYAEDERHSIQFREKEILIKGKAAPMTATQLLEVAAAKPHYFSPNVLLRPLYQDALLPTVAYIAGPAEIAYYAQMKGIYEKFNLPMPIIYPRKSLTLLEGKIKKTLNNYKLAAPDFWQNIDLLINEIARKQMPDHLQTKIADTALSLDKELQSLEKMVVEIEPTLVDFITNTRGRLRNQIDGMEKKILQAFKKNNEVMRLQLQKGADNLYPNGNFQERQLNITPYLFKYGFGLIDKLYEATDISHFDHQVVEI